MVRAVRPIRISQQYFWSIFLARPARPGRDPGVAVLDWPLAGDGRLGPDERPGRHAVQVERCWCLRIRRLGGIGRSGG
ncbi:hypothetical protein SBBP2_280035 [Burkholderiales bacterium]|nr:hypothetical protein SBBP2_280035 [Burkholderiales bacterium]